MSTADAGERIEDHGTAVDEGNSIKVRCNYCAKEVNGFNRLKHHLGAMGSDVVPCIQVPAEIKECMRNALIEKKKERLLKEVGVLYHPDLPLKRNFTATSSETRCCQLKLSQPATSDPNTSINQSANGNSCQLNHSTPSETGRNVVVDPTPMGTANNGVSDPDIAEEVDPDVKKDMKDESALSAATCIGRFFYESGLELTATNLPSFQRMVDALTSCQTGYTVPRYEELKGWILREELNAVNAHVKDVRCSWEHTGCSILLDGWTDQTGRSLMDFLVDCPKGRIFLRSVDVTDAVHDVDELFLLICAVVEEVGVGNVVQVVAHDTSCYMEAVGKKLVDRYKTLFWTLSADYCINLILEKIGMMDHVKKVLAEAKTITRFIYNHALPLELMKKYTGGDLVKASKLRSVAAFITLGNMVSARENLMHMFSSPTWNASIVASKSKGKNISELVKNPSFWAAADDVIKVTNPLINVLDQINGADKPPMGLIYDAMDRAKEAIKLNLGGRETNSLPFWIIIDDIWNNYLHSPLHSAGYYLNPSLFYSDDFFVDAEVANGILSCIVRTIEDQHTQKLVVQQLEFYRRAIGGFAEEMAIVQRTKVPPVLWWSQHGKTSPELQSFAIKILSQTCRGAVTYKLRNSLSEQLHGKGSNCIERQRFLDVEFIRNNLRLWHSPANEDEKGRKRVQDELDPSDDWIVEC